MSRIVSREKFAALVRDGLKPGDAATPIVSVANVCRSIAPVAKAEGDLTPGRAFDFVISTESQDRYGDEIMADGWDLSNYEKNPVVLWAHESDELPIAVARNTRIEGGALLSTADFGPTEDLSPMSAMVASMLERRVLNAASVGFRPTAWAASDTEGAPPMALRYLGQELMEWSIVPVPANPEALIAAKSAGVDLGPLKSWAESVLDACDLAGELRTKVERAYQISKAGRVLSKANESRLIDARDCIDSVLRTLEPEPEKSIEPAKPEELVGAAERAEPIVLILK